jgi:hypothetical protein
VIKCRLFEYTKAGGKGVVSEFLDKNPGVRKSAKVRFHDLRLYGVGTEDTLAFCPHIQHGIYKLKVKATPQFRPHLCKGPAVQFMEKEATLLACAIEQNFELRPDDVLDQAVERRDIVKADETRRKALDERDPRRIDDGTS